MKRIDGWDGWMNAFDAYPQPINSPTGRLDCFHYYVLENRYSLWYVLYCTALWLVRYGTVHVLYLSVCSTTHHHHRRRTSEKKEKKAERCFCFLASCRIIMSTLCRVYGDLGARALLGYVVGTVLFIRAYGCDVVWLQWLRFMYVCTVCIPRYLGGCIHQVSIPHIQYNTYIHTHLHTRPLYPRYSKVGTYARPAYQPDDSPQTQSRKAKQPKPATSRLPSLGVTATVNGLPNYCIQEN